MQPELNVNKKKNFFSLFCTTNNNTLLFQTILYQQLLRINYHLVETTPANLIMSDNDSLIRPFGKHNKIFVFVYFYCCKKRLLLYYVC